MYTFYCDYIIHTEEGRKWICAVFIIIMCPPSRLRRNCDHYYRPLWNSLQTHLPPPPSPLLGGNCYPIFLLSISLLFILVLRQVGINNTVFDFEEPRSKHKARCVGNGQDGHPCMKIKTGLSSCRFWEPQLVEFGAGSGALERLYYGTEGIWSVGHCG